MNEESCTNCFVCVCVCVCLRTPRERERERESVCVCVWSGPIRFVCLFVFVTSYQVVGIPGHEMMASCLLLSRRNQDNSSPFPCCPPRICTTQTNPTSAVAACCQEVTYLGINKIRSGRHLGHHQSQKKNEKQTTNIAFAFFASSSSSLSSYNLCVCQFPGGEVVFWSSLMMK